jgi:urea transport system ATP-binding protein
MSAEEREETGQLLKRIGSDRVIIVIEHDMEFVRNFADSVTVMHGGKVLSEGTVSQIQADPRVQEVYLGRTADAELDPFSPPALTKEES